ncbi:MAG: DUF4397 domain-containing protein [Ilumatobacter sp.]|uniref:DUF4397 domain-containing protein n=1 Tax=Ilumatobacter sp. TaxID=1967498 RepID=UPI003298CF62
MKKMLLGVAALAATALLAPSSAGAQSDAAEVMLLHGIPGVEVDVVVDGDVVIPGFEPGTMQDLSSFAGQTLANLEVRVAGTEDIAIGPVPEFAVPATGSWTVVAHLDAEGTPSITPFENNTAQTADGQGRLTVRHTAAAPAVDLVVGDARPVEGAENGASADLELPAGEIAGAQIAPAGGDPIADVPTVELAAGENLIVYAVGSLEDETFTFYVQERTVGSAAPAQGEAGDGTPAPTEVNTGDALQANDTAPLLAAALGLLVIGVGAGLTAHRRSSNA